MQVIEIIVYRWNVQKNYNWISFVVCAIIKIPIDKNILIFFLLLYFYSLVKCLWCWAYDPNVNTNMPKERPSNTIDMIWDRGQTMAFLEIQFYLRHESINNLKGNKEFRWFRINYCGQFLWNFIIKGFSKVG